MFFKKKGGRNIIAKKHTEGRGEIYARIGQDAEDGARGNDAEKIIREIGNLQTKNIQINKFYITEDKYVIYLRNGKYYFITYIKKGLEFPKK